MRALYKYIIPLAALLIACGSEQAKDGSGDSDLPRDSLIHTMVAPDSVTAFELLQLNHEVEYRSSMMGVFVTTIDSVENSISAYWVYSVNSEMIPMASDRHFVAPGDTVRWHLRKSKQ